MRKQTSQLTRLIWDFYRENQTELQKLKLLGKCKVFRSWGVLHIRCGDRKIAETVISLRSLIEEPIAKLRIAREIQISVNNTPITLLQIGKPSPRTKDKEMKER
ncbi:hypothetical protein [Spirulina sp. 06S082]|uniref:hypothetical protein n=1 Tax=Spirulina sp. 06S082 TaxID=3110248 RepID=UPI002B1F235D|nr:hypothetical protein [Spirulina sp. 06S082]MEA5470807.1 hypothetical protein [Spirulina sp. 06S082]